MDIMTSTSLWKAQPLVPLGSRGPLAPAVARSVARIGAKSRLTGELRSIAVDLLGPYESDELPTECAAWVDATIEAAVSAVCQRSLTALIRTLDALLAIAPPEVARQLDEIRVRHDAGLI
jgi:hypothetical protein